MNGWCVLRKIKIHADIAQYAFCHHWGHQEPSLPLLNNTSLTKDKQLNFDRELANIQS